MQWPWGVTQGYWKWHHLIARTRIPIRLPSLLWSGHILYRLRDKAMFRPKIGTYSYGHVCESFRARFRNRARRLCYNIVQNVAKKSTLLAVRSSVTDGRRKSRCQSPNQSSWGQMSLVVADVWTVWALSSLFLYYINCMLLYCNAVYVCSDIFLIRYRRERLLCFGYHRYSPYVSTCREQARSSNAGLGKYWQSWSPERQTLCFGTLNIVIVLASKISEMLHGTFVQISTGWLRPCIL